ncbi:MAG: transcriptional repressor [Bacteroidales bacterium]|nr:transcriptional repressor [Bacteroidales bacterium]MDD4822747.1 transcriptional repressor [Bacteroidales bacterium]
MKAIDVLNIHNLKRTSCREGIIDIMLSTNQALSENDIRNQLSYNFDRTTFYRSFKTLEEHKIIHKIIIDNQIIKYAIDKSITDKKGHAHFFCNHCHIVKCLDSVPMQEIQLPDGYAEDEIDILIKGTCPTCKKKYCNH